MATQGPGRTPGMASERSRPGARRSTEGPREGPLGGLGSVPEHERRGRPSSREKAQIPSFFLGWPDRASFSGGSSPRLAPPASGRRASASSSQPSPRTRPFQEGEGSVFLGGDHPRPGVEDRVQRPDALVPTITTHHADTERYPSVKRTDLYLLTLGQTAKPYRRASEPHIHTASPPSPLKSGRGQLWRRDLGRQ